MREIHAMSLAMALAVGAFGCGGDGDGEEAASDAGDAGDDGGDGGGPDGGDPVAPGEEFDRFCLDRDWDQSLVPGAVGELGEEYLGHYADLPEGTLETVKLIPPHPFWVTRLKAAFSGSPGPVRLRLMRSFGRSYPDTDAPDGDLTVPFETELESVSPDEWLEVDVEDQGVFLLPTEHYIAVLEHPSDEAPSLALEEISEGDYSRGMLHIPGEETPYGIEGNYRFEIEGRFFCSWAEGNRWLGEDDDQPFVDDQSQRVAIADLDGDGHDDLVLNAGGPIAYLGDGAGGFSEPGIDPFPEGSAATMLVFGDLDNDGDADAFAATYVGADGDGDGSTVAEGDCNDADETVGPLEEEIPDNGVDDDCDGTADDGTDTGDGDGDGVSIADGDCDDTRETVYPDAPELLDSMDNDCDGIADDDHVNAIWLGDGTGRLSALPSAGVEALDPSAAAALGDGNGDGFLDVYWGNWLEHYPDPGSVPDRYAVGNGDGTFTDATESAGMVPPGAPEPCYGVLWGDYDGDGDQDVWVGNYGYGRNFLWQNQGDGTFEEWGSMLGVHMDGIGAYGGNTFGGDFGDIDNDGDLDLYAASIAHPRYQPWSDPSVLLVNQGPPLYDFADRREDLGLAYDEGDVNAAFADYDNDMDLDLAVASLYGGHYCRLYRNDGIAGFTDVTYEAGVAVNDSVSAVWCDVDEDGDLDLFVADRAGAPWVHLFVNRVGQDAHWIELVLEGTSTNRDGIGARVELTAGGVTQIREVEGGGGHSNTQGSRVVHFGLASEPSIEGATVRWVGGATEEISGLAPGGRYLVVEGSGQGSLLE